MKVGVVNIKGKLPFAVGRDSGVNAVKINIMEVH